ncbi:hypothetical protein CBS147324_1500 [Aspergillus niger]|nr:hypothetical protein CBS147324_1500 [Aspergillus niger]
MGSACQANDQSISGEEYPGRAGIDVRNPPKVLGKYVGSLASPNYTATNAEHVEDITKDSALVAYNTDKHLAMSGSVALSGVPCHGDAGRYPFGPDVLRTCVCTRGRTANEHKAARYPIVVDEQTGTSYRPATIINDFLQEARDWLAVNLIRSTF